MQDDLADAVLWAGQRKLIDPAKVCIAGSGYGGYATLMGLVRHPELFRCGAAWSAMTDPLRLLESSWFRDDVISDEARRYTLPVLLGDRQKDAEMLKAASPLAQAARIRAPLLLAYGAIDQYVTIGHGTALRAALQAVDRDPEWIVYRGEGHGWRQLQHRVDFANRLQAFFAKHLQ